MQGYAHGGVVTNQEAELTQCNGVIVENIIQLIYHGVGAHGDFVSRIEKKRRYLPSDDIAIAATECVPSSVHASIIKLSY